MILSFGEHWSKFLLHVLDDDPLVAFVHQNVDFKTRQFNQCEVNFFIWLNRGGNDHDGHSGVKEVGI